MIYAFTGKTGSGKTFHMVKEAYKAWLAGTDIYSNTVLFFINEGGTDGVNICEHGECFTWWEKALDKINKTYADYFHKNYEPRRRGRIRYFEHISEILEAKNGLIIFDEAQVLFNARLWESLPEEFQYKLQQSRKHDLTLFASMQNMGTVDITYRRLVHVWYHHVLNWSWGNPMWIGSFKFQIKDVDYLYNTVDDLQVPTLEEKNFWISKWSRRLYDTLYDIGFKRFKTIWIQEFTDRRFKSKWMIIPKKQSLKDALRVISLQKSVFFPKKYPDLKRS